MPKFSGDIDPHFYEWENKVDKYLEITTYKMSDIAPYLITRLDGRAKSIVNSTFQEYPTTSELMKCLRNNFSQHYSISNAIMDHLKHFYMNSRNQSKGYERIANLLEKLRILEEKVPSYRVCNTTLREAITNINLSIDLQNQINEQYDEYKNDPDYSLLNFITKKINTIIIYSQERKEETRSHVTESSRFPHGSTYYNDNRSRQPQHSDSVTEETDPNDCAICSAHVRDGGTISDPIHIYTKTRGGSLLIRPESCSVIRWLKHDDREERMTLLGICRVCGVRDTTNSHTERECNDLTEKRKFLLCSVPSCSIRASFCGRHRRSNSTTLAKIRENLKEHNISSSY